ncbi:hypothetical protein L7F22_009547 [Adiantum nelumboides]|nr:hypothetical protein [Adiantum nelumboides]
MSEEWQKFELSLQMESIEFDEPIAFLFYLDLLMDTHLEDSLITSEDESQQTSEIDQALSFQSVSTIENMVKAEKLKEEPIDLALEKKESENLDVARSRAKTVVDEPTVDDPVKGTSLTLKLAKDFEDLEGEAKEFFIALDLETSNEKFLEAPDAFEFYLKRVDEEEPALKYADFEVRLVELGIDKFGRNVLEPDKINANLGAKINLEHEGQIEADELQKIELLDVDNFLERAGEPIAFLFYLGLLMDTHHEDSLITSEDESQQTSEIDQALSFQSVSTIENMVKAEKLKEEPIDLALEKKESENLDVARSRAKTVVDEPTVDVPVKGTSLTLKLAKDFEDLEGEAKEFFIALDLQTSNEKFLEAPDAFEFYLKRVDEEEPALKYADFEVRLVELGIDKFGRNVLEPDKINADLGAKINLEHEGQIEADELQKDTANTIYTNSQSALAVARNPVFHALTKHIEVHYHYVRERLSTGEINLAYEPTQDNLADLFTKAMSHEKLEAFHKALGLLPFVDRSCP